MTRDHARPRREAIPERSRALVPAAATCGLLWLGAVLADGLGIEGPGVIVLGTAGVLATAFLLLVIQRQHARLRSLAATDALTGLVNHRTFHEILASELERGHDQGVPVGLVMIDLDDFKDINDSLGHPYGDEVLRNVGAAIRAAVRGNDTPARVGGEEFGLILPGSDSAAAFAVAERARAAVEALEPGEIRMSCSAGVAA